MPPKNAPRTRVSLDDDWLAAFDDQSQTTAEPEPEPEPVAPRPAPRRRPRPAPVETSGDDWLNALDRSRDVPRGRSNGKAPRPTFDAETEQDDDDESTPTEPRRSWFSRLAGLRSRFGRPALFGAGGVTVGLVVSFVFRPTPPPTPAPTPPSVAVPTPPVDPSARELIVAPTAGEGVLTSLNEAIRTASAGQRIRVKPGTYAGAVVVDKPVEIVGDGKPSEVILTSDGGTGLVVKAETAVVRGLTVRVKPDADKGRGVEVRSGRVVLEELEIEAPEAGLVVSGETTAPVVRQVTVRGASAHSLVAVEKAGGFFEKCQFLAGTKCGVLIRGEARPILRGCEVKAEAGAGVVVSDRGEGTFIDCRLLGGAKAGAVVAEGGRLRLLGGDVTGFSAEGVLVAKDGEAVLDGTRVGNNTRAGVVVGAGGRLVLHRCNLSGNTGGDVHAEPGGQVITDTPRPDPPPTIPRPMPTPATNPPQRPAPPTSTAPVPPAEAGQPLPEPPPDFDGYRNTTPQ